MRITTAASTYHVDGRIRGSYVYLLLCQSADGIYVKVGMSDSPQRRLQSLMTSSPLRPGVMATVELPTRKTALRCEHAILCALDRWRVKGREWFLFAAADKAEFNTKLHMATVAFASPAWPVTWSKFSVRKMLAAARSRRGLFQSRMRRRGRAYKDFATQTTKAERAFL
jgi:hypothetical protein